MVVRSHSDPRDLLVLLYPVFDSDAPLKLKIQVVHLANDSVTLFLTYLGLHHGLSVVVLFPRLRQPWRLHRN